MALLAGMLVVLYSVLFTICQPGVDGQDEHNHMHKVHKILQKINHLLFNGPTEERRCFQPFHFSLPFSTLVRKTQKRETKINEDFPPQSLLSRQLSSYLFAPPYILDLAGGARLIPWTRAGCNLSRGWASMEKVSGGKLANLAPSTLYFPFSFNKQYKVKKSQYL